MTSMTNETRSVSYVNARVVWDVVFLFSVVLGVFVVVFRDSLLPRRFFYDGEHIQQIALGFNSGLGDQSYVRVALVYRSLGLASHPLAAGLLGFGLAVAAFLFFRISSTEAPGWQAIIVTPIALVTMAVYLGFYSKDVFLIPIASLAVVASRRRRWEVLTVAAMLAYALLFRTYWVLVALAYVAIRIAFRRRWKASSITVLIVSILVAFCLSIYYIVGVDPDHYRSMVNDARASSVDAASAILPLIPGENLAVGIVNVLATLILLVLPVPLLLIGSGYHAALFLGISALWGLFFHVAHRRRTGRFEGDLKAGGSRSMGRSATDRSIAVVLALLTVQALFEPDYGSALRHLTPFLLVWVSLAWLSPAADLHAEKLERAVA